MHLLFETVSASGGRYECGGLVCSEIVGLIPQKAIENLGRSISCASKTSARKLVLNRIAERWRRGGLSDFWRARLSAAPPAEAARRPARVA